MAGLSYSDSLFVKNNVPLRFWLRPSTTKERVRRLIEAGGGEVVSKMGPDVIRLSEPTTKVLSEGAISTRYITDCIQANSLLDLSSYKIHPETAVSDFSDVENPPVLLRRRVRRGVQPYTRKEEEAILQWICKNHRYSEVKGRRMWEILEQLEVVKNRSWQSMKEHFIKKILPNLEHFDRVITTFQMEKFDATFSNELDVTNDAEVAEEDSSQLQTRIQVSKLTNSDKMYKYRDDMEIIEFLLKSNDSNAIRGNFIWKLMADQKVTRHSWQSMKERFLKRILRDLSQYSLSSTERSKLLKRAGKSDNHYEPIAGSSPLCRQQNRNKAKSKNKVEDSSQPTISLDESNIQTASSPKKRKLGENEAAKQLKESSKRSVSSLEIQPQFDSQTSTEEYQDAVESKPRVKRLRKRRERPKSAADVDIASSDDEQKDKGRYVRALASASGPDSSDLEVMAPSNQHNESANSFRDILKTKLETSHTEALCDTNHEKETSQVQNRQDNDSLNLPDLKMLDQDSSNSSGNEHGTAANTSHIRAKYIKEFIKSSDESSTEEDLTKAGSNLSQSMRDETHQDKEISDQMEHVKKWLIKHHPQTERSRPNTRQSTRP